MSTNNNNKYKRKTKRLPKKHRHNLSLSKREEIIKLRALGTTYNEIAAKVGCSYQTVEYQLRRAKHEDDVIKRARAKAYEEMAGQITEKAQQALDKITPDSLTHDRVERRDAEGNLVSVQHSGPTGQQIAVTAGILLDQASKLQDRADRLNDRDIGGDLNPANLRQLVESVGGSIKRLQFLNVDIEGLSSLQDRVAELGDRLEADYEVMDEGEGSEDQ